MARRRALCQLLFGLAACLALAACSERATPGSELPSGALLFGRRVALERLLATAARLAGTPLARHARAFAERLPRCDWVEARAPEASQLADTLACGDPAGSFAALDRERGKHDIAFALPLREGARLIGTANVAADGSLSLSLVLPGDAFTGPAAFLLPGPHPAGEPVLSASEQIVHARVRAAKRLDLAAFVPEDSQASRLFRLKSALFSGMVLDDTWEIAVYPSDVGQRSPRTALALGTRERSAAIAAIEEFLANLRKSWPVHRSAFSIGRASGACLLDLNLLPDLAPCYVATEHALVIGWNSSSLRKALDGAGAEPAAAGEFTGAGSLVLDFDRVEQADVRLRALAPAGSALLPQPAYPWRRLQLSGERGRAGIELRLELAAKESA